MWTIVISALIVFAIWKRPGGIARLANDTLKFEIFKELRARGKERDSKSIPSVEDMEERFTRRIVAGTAVILAIFTAMLWHPLGPWALIVGSIPSASFAAILWRVTSHTRNVVLPLYLTLCRMPGARWDPRGKPTKWIRISKDPGKPIFVRLPKDWHASTMGVKMVEEIVKQRVPGEWKCRVDRPRFLMTFVPTGAIAVTVGDEQERSPVPVDLEKEEFEIPVKGAKSPW